MKSEAFNFGVGFVSFKVTVENSKDWDAEEGSETGSYLGAEEEGQEEAIVHWKYLHTVYSDTRCLGRLHFFSTILYSYILTFLSFELSFFCG